MSFRRARVRCGGCCEGATIYLSGIRVVQGFRAVFDRGRGPRRGCGGLWCGRRRAVGLRAGPGKFALSWPAGSAGQATQAARPGPGYPPPAPAREQLRAASRALFLIAPAVVHGAGAHAAVRAIDRRPRADHGLDDRVFLGAQPCDARAAAAGNDVAGDGCRRAPQRARVRNHRNAAGAGAVSRLAPAGAQAGHAFFEPPQGGHHPLTAGPP
jgi:hypothetical protein